MKDATLTEYLQARIQTLETENKKLRTDNTALSNALKIANKARDGYEQMVVNLKREKVAMQTR